MEQDEKRKLADELRNAADDVLNLDDMEKVAGGLLDLKCVNNNVALCGCTQTSTEKLQQAKKDQGQIEISIIVCVKKQEYCHMMNRLVFDTSFFVQTKNLEHVG